MSQSSPSTTEKTPGDDLAEPERTRAFSADVISEEGLRDRRSHSTAITTAAVIIAAGNFLTFLSLPWTQSAVFGDADPAIWITLGLLIPAALLCFSVYRSYWVRRESGVAELERIGPYVLKEKLGSGGMGDVFLAEHQLMKRHCAVKLIHPQNASNGEMRKSFEREAKATAHLTHWNTIEIYDYGTSEDGRFYYVMEYLRGVNLWHYVQKFGPMPPGRVVYLLKQLCDALYEADCAGLVHRDIKPSNIFLTERGQSFDVVKLLDFGLVQTITRDPIHVRNVSTKLHGSPSFMCPEQAVGLSPDSRGDLYSLGAVAYFLLTGRPPFVDANPIMLIVAHATTDVPTFEEIGADVPPDLGTLVMKCLSRDPEHRFDSARELRMHLDACDCSRDWNWQAAEQWWLSHSPTMAREDQSPKSVVPTQSFDRDTEPEIAEVVRVNYEEPTMVVDNPLALEELAVVN